MYQFSILNSIGFSEIIIFIILLVVGLIIVSILKTVLYFILPIIAALVVWFITSNLIYAGIAFVVVAILQLILRR
ncbi:MAG: hypothetical protein NWF08_08440 [Candidatus Bathyarchaeota archaeon]|nr:hypothetical protein [Candidatus Bathyarchaeota archaeon]